MSQALTRFFYTNTGLKDSPIKANKQKLSVAFTAVRNEAGEQVVAYGVSVCHPIDAKQFQRKIGREQALKALQEANHPVNYGNVIFPTGTNLDEIPGLIEALFNLRQKTKINADNAAKAERIAEIRKEIDVLYLENDGHYAEISKVNDKINKLDDELYKLVYGESVEG